MSMTKAAVVAATSSSCCLVVGVYAGYFLTKRRISEQYEAWLEDQVRETKAFFSQRYKTDDYADPVALAERLANQSEAAETEVDIRVTEKMVPDDFTPEEHTRYNEISTKYREPAPEVEGDTPISPEGIKPADGESMAEFETRLQEEARARVQEVIDRVGSDPVEEEREEVETVVVSNVFDTNGVSPSEPGPDPYIVGFMEFVEGEDGYSQNLLTWYAQDKVLCDEHNNPISNIDEIIGGVDNLQFGNASKDANIVYIRNDGMNVDFEVVFDPGSYSQEVLHISPNMTGKRQG